MCCTWRRRRRHNDTSVMIMKFISSMLHRRGRGAGGITYDEAVAVARRYGIGQAIEVACRKYGVSPRQALADFDLVEPGATDEDIRRLAYTSCQADEYGE